MILRIALALGILVILDIRQTDALKLFWFELYLIVLNDVKKKIRHGQLFASVKISYLIFHLILCS